MPLLKEGRRARSLSSQVLETVLKSRGRDAERVSTHMLDDNMIAAALGFLVHQPGKNDDGLDDHYWVYRKIGECWCACPSMMTAGAAKGVVAGASDSHSQVLPRLTRSSRLRRYS